MRAVSILVGGSLVLAGPAVAQSGGDRLKALQDKARPLVILSDARDDPRVAKQLAALDRTKAAVNDRDIAILREAEPGSALRKTLGVADRGFMVVLVGKDGSVKNVWRAPVDPKVIFRSIDAMPMRQREMRG